MRIGAKIAAVRKVATDIQFTSCINDGGEFDAEREAFHLEWKNHGTEDREEQIACPSNLASSSASPSA